MQDDSQPSLEAALAHTEADADAVLKAAATATSALKKLRAAAHAGNLRDLGPAMDTADKALAGLTQQFEGVKQG